MRQCSYPITYRHRFNFEQKYRRFIKLADLIRAVAEGMSAHHQLN